MILSKGEGGACVYTIGAAVVFYSSTLDCEEKAKSDGQRANLRWSEKCEERLGREDEKKR